MRVDKSWLPEAISALAVPMLSVLLRTSPTMRTSADCMPPSAVMSWVSSSRPTVEIVWVRSPCMMAVATRWAWSSGWQMLCMLASVEGTTTSAARAKATPNHSVVCPLM
ncbi:hypothetical protein Y695_03509 [Hydrogenophaga sp. T4]|nr:hypothetical protein Y695_03509 [Hydrogenophaga sp. T4]